MCKLKQKSKGNCYVQVFQIWLNMTANWGDVGQQHDANDFFVKLISPLVEEVGEQFHIEQICTCIFCNYCNTI